MLNVSGLCKSFGGFHAVKDVGFSVPVGHTLGFLGPNGAGKTTTVRLITGFIRPDAGSVTICDIDALKNPVEARAHIGYLPEGAPLYGDMTPSEYLSFIGTIRKLRGNAYKNAFDRVVTEINLQDALQKPIETLSKGFKRRVGLAGALLSDPPVLILDEPTDGLDPNQKRQVRNLIRKLAKQKAVIISTHILEEVEAVCTDTIIINRGMVVSSATPKELFEQSVSYNAVTLIIAAENEEQAINLFQKERAVREVKRISQMPKWCKITVYPKEGKYILGDVSAVIHANGWRVASVTPETGRLDEVFYKLTAATLS